MNIKKFLASTTISGAVLLNLATPILAAPPVLFGDVTIVAGGNPGNAASLVSDVTLTNGYSGVTFTLPDDTAWADLDTVSTDYNVTDDNCGGGSPRFQIKVDTDNDGISNGNVHVAIGPSPSFTGCLPGWQSTGNVIGNEDAGRYDYSAFGGSPFTTYSNAPASVLAGEVISVQLVVDGSWSVAATGGDGEQTVLVDNVLVNADLHTFEPNTPASKDACKKGGWDSLEDADGNPFKNQGQCVAYFNHNN
ncbi:MAG: hypothetical protein ACD_30C00039G0002 [uncultured bacterium]|uniref:Endonuclease/exonuclease/phosphatase n=4 Tax=Candidatus Daviesiibacteriota TaxID=1752718 RepID=A0A0G0H8X2_9BACT|nr:MAG: hypothetical protein ACD_30C00039G0002 [uncultured bacterium]KKQ08544.1 MAG: Endonuclease/exonuclease/phosphatase [Candidatus Daviesbacteria bacterium GW2011_GWB1_36_5]OGE17100.1 MAG: hypothetical protein A2858_00140 [Candidatus Daviesbacteria bacterium RIFCSPHIGHO2_01_FULL_36_37]OGE31250.1 MAG: hypothetical protein A3C99_01225 [Candidatus Daviesbacteria bacterium RIFCSPHIGHO2_02_FULL_37_9]OGE35881.1 MAG: hypothetical protein A3E66_01135 [Candidatus Daviesbacteria bacterium RIFCSPHIGHO2